MMCCYFGKRDIYIWYVSLSCMWKVSYLITLFGLLGNVEISRLLVGARSCLCV